MIRTVGRAPLCQIGWQFADNRVASRLCVGNALFDGDYRTSWEFYRVPQRLALVSSLSYLKGGETNLPRGLMIPTSSDGRYLHALAHDVISETKHNLNSVTFPHDMQSVFHRAYDVIVPLPSSKGPASPPNNDICRVISRALGGVNDAGPPIEHVIKRTRPMLVKSTKADRSTRRNPDAPRLMHFGTMSIEPSLLDSIKNQKILLYDDVYTWGNTSEAARNLLLLAGASEVDILTVFSTGPMSRAATYEFNNDGRSFADTVRNAPLLDPDMFLSY